MENNGSKVITIDTEKEMKKSFLDYSMSVIVSRALPDVRDGLKPVHRRILYTMYENGLTPDKPYRKCADTVGSVLGRYHPHGDASVYDAMVRLAQDFSMRYPLVDGHGNFGSVDGDPAAAYRYTECRNEQNLPLACSPISTRTRWTLPPTTTTACKEPVVLPRPVPQPAGQRLHRHRRGHGHQHPAPQPGGGHRRGCAASSTTPTPPWRS